MLDTFYSQCQRNASFNFNLKYIKLINKYYCIDVKLQRKKLKRTSVPSRNLHCGEAAKNTKLSNARLQRKINRNIKKDVANQVKEKVPFEIVDVPEVDNIMHDTEESSKNDEVIEISQQVNKRFNDFGVQVETMFLKSSFMNFIKNENDFTTAMGIQSYKILDTIVEIVQQTYGSLLHNNKISLRDRIVMTYVKLKQNVSYSFLAIIFNSCTARHCQRIFYSTLKMLSKCLKIFIPWPSRDEISKNIPTQFEIFKDVRVVVDCTEIFIQAPTKLCCQEIVYSQYKSSPTCKIMTGVSPGGLITFLSKPYGGRPSDTEIFRQSNIKDLLEPGDGVMCDRGFLIDELCARYSWKLIRPPFLKDKKQFTKHEAILTSQIAKARVHIERSNQRIKSFAIVGETMSVKLVPILDDILTVICGTVNLSSPILNDDKFMTVT